MELYDNVSRERKDITKTCPCNAIYRVFSAVKPENFIRKFSIFLTCLLKTLILGTRLGLGEAVLTSTHKSQYMFWIKDKKNRYTPIYSIFIEFNSGV